MIKEAYSTAIADLTSSLQLDPHRGLTAAEVLRQRAACGANVLPKVPTRSVFAIVLGQFLSPLIYLLLTAAVASAFLGDVKDAAVIAVVVIFNAIIGAIQEGRAERSLAALRQLSALKARVLRDGEACEIEASDVVVGDVVLLAEGDAVPSDARLIDTAGLMVTEAGLTGESLPIAKNTEVLAASTALADRSNMVYAGTLVTAGRGSAIVVATGSQNEIGRIASLTERGKAPATQLELKVQAFGHQVVFAACGLFALIVAIGWWRGFSMSEIVLVGISQVVSLVPEGLPVAITIALAVGVQRMARRGTIVRRLPAVESLGSTTVIATDKTGTLTRNEMTVVEIYLPGSGRTLTVDGSGYAPVGGFLHGPVAMSPQVDLELTELLRCIALCNDASLVPPETASGVWRGLGDPTEVALLTVAAKGGIDAAALRASCPRLGELPFSSEHKLMAVSVEHDGQVSTLLKGAPEAILALGAGGDDLSRVSIMEMAASMADRALRVLACAVLPGYRLESGSALTDLVGKPRLLGLVAQYDPPRTEVKAAIGECHAAGIRLVMLTGDHKKTGMAIARQLGILRDQDLALSGDELDRLDKTIWVETVARAAVFARLRPEQKLQIVEALRARGEVVAMTGDGVNDAPALASADVGIAMGISGTEVAKDAAKVVITDDNFATIVAAVAEGRLVYQNIKKLLIFLLVTSIDEVIILVGAMLGGFSPPLAAVQILWLNLVSEGVLTVNLVMESAEGDEMRRPPRSPKVPLLDRHLLWRMPLMISISSALCLGWFFYRRALGTDPVLVQTETFTLLVVCQWFNVLNCRSAERSVFSRDIFSNHWLIGGLIAANILHILVIYWRPLGDFFHTVPLPWPSALLLGGLASVVLWTEELRKVVARRMAVLTDQRRCVDSGPRSLRS